ncbi:MAG: enoyl-CoA hydratase/isomerase family protein [Proteobacteria bacterium]|nr:enoyl-CoA hydratase/isomerase family protein [Pseudomonadota bacterium]
MSAEEKLVLSERTEQGVVTIKFNSPENKNAMNEKMSEQFVALVSELKSDKKVRAVILTGAGEAFSAGGNLDMLLAKTKIEKIKNKELMLKFYRNFLSISELNVPVIAAINGHAVGAGLCVALSCDIRIAVEDAKLGLNFLSLGLHPGMGVTYFLPRLVGPARAAELLFTGKILTASEALCYGLISHLVKSAELSDKIDSIIKLILNSGPEATLALKQSLRESLALNLSSCLDREAAAQSESYAGGEFLEGIMAAKEKRKAKFC